VVIALLTTGLMIWIEGFFALKRKDPPEEPGKPYPPASAIIAAYLPNEAMTIVETVQSFLKIDYPAPLQIIVAYNTPRDMPIEKVLQEIAAVDPRLVPMRVEGSESKAQNVNAAIARVTGEFVGVFDADHHPQPDSFTRAWRWLSQGCEIVQGHCQVRNGDSSWVARMVAVEFEAIYAVSHPGRTRLYGFGVFGGSNGYWKTDLLRETRMHGFMLTEDIDSSMRVTESGHIIVTDPYLVSRELAPGSIKALWNQRMRWAQGWFQVSREHLLYAIRSKKLNLRQKIGAIYLLGWREIYPWLSVQMFPIIAFWVTKYGGLNKIDWLIPIFVLTTLFTLSVGPGQTFLAYRLGAEEIRKNKGWYFLYLILTSLFYTEFKNIIARVAQVKEIMGERSWRITPREK
jgi:cellulose synthase/poly-beta-1,6-N-acetylglucosamine synthase-like glycosyltransferase